MITRILGLVCSVAVLSAAMAPATAADRIGVTSAVQRDVTGTLGGNVRNLNAGLGVFRDERINTREKSTAQLLFLDETSLAIGPSSEVVLDRFVYNPSGTAQEVSVETVKGAFRFVSGSSNPQNYKVKTPLATIGVRGTIFDLLVSATRTIVILVEGAVDVCVNAVCTGIVQPGKYVVVHADGSMEGPKTWDNSIRNVRSRVSFPLYGNRLEGDRSRHPGANDRRSSVDEIERREYERYYRQEFRYFDVVPGGHGKGGGADVRGGGGDAHRGGVIRGGATDIRGGGVVSGGGTDISGGGTSIRGGGTGIISGGTSIRGGGTSIRGGGARRR